MSRYRYAREYPQTMRRRQQRRQRRQTMALLALIILVALVIIVSRNIKAAREREAELARQAEITAFITAHEGTFQPGVTINGVELTGYSYKYFIQEHNLEFLVAVFWALVVAGLLVAFVPRDKFLTLLRSLKSKFSHKKITN